MMEKKSKPLVTVITLSYNNFSHIRETIESVLEQDYDRIEYLFFDDCSKDFPEEEIRNYIESGDKKVQQYSIVCHPENLGTVKNMNAAYRAAQGEIIMPLSCGDVFFSRDVVSKVVERFEATGCHMLTTSRLLYKGDFQPVGLLPHYGAREILAKADSALKQYKAYMTSHFLDMTSGCVMYLRKDIAEHFGYFDEEYDLWEDGPFLTKYLWKDRIEYAFDLISIWYEDGGVSANTFDNLSPRMRRDVVKFAENEFFKHKEVFSPAELRRMKYRQKRMICGRSSKKYLLYLAYFPEMIHYQIFTKNNRKNSVNDMDYIREYMEKNKNVILMGEKIHAGS